MQGPWLLSCPRARRTFLSFPLKRKRHTCCGRSPMPVAHCPLQPYPARAPRLQNLSAHVSSELRDDKEMSASHTRHTALVTGASRGLGSTIAMELAAAGSNVAVNYFNSNDAAKRLCERIEQAGGHARAFKADVPFLSIEEQTWESYLDQLEFFVKSPLLLLKQVLPRMKHRGFGRIINIGSEVFELGNPRFANYVAAKGAQLGLTRSWARELAPTGITVNLVAPGWIPTERHADATQDELDSYARNVPMMRMGCPEDIARMVAFLSSDAAGFITGQKFTVNGGNTLA
jgi:3-oxoacyl-[acyl-carrier protein] reductase